MGKRIITQARGKGSLRYQAKKRAYIYTIKYPSENGEGIILKLLHSPAHSAPLMKVKIKNNVFYNPAFVGAIEGEKIQVNGDIKEGNVAKIKELPISTKIYNIELNPGDGGKMIRTAGSSAMVNKKYDYNKIGILLPSKKEVILDGECRATIGVIAGDGRKLKPFITAGRKFYKMQAKGKLWPRTSAVKMNAVDHPFGSGRGKRIKQKIAQRNMPAGRRVGHLRPRRTGRVK